MEELNNTTVELENEEKNGCTEARENGKREKVLFIFAFATVLTSLATVAALFYGYLTATNIVEIIKLGDNAGWQGIGIAILLVYMLILLIAMGVLSVIALCFSIPNIKLAVNKMRAFSIAYTVLNSVYIVLGVVSFLVTVGLISS